MQHTTAIEELLAYINTGKTAEYLFFWGHHQQKDGRISNSCLSNWYPAAFTMHGETYATTEHDMMSHKAQLFDDMRMHHAILNAKTPKEAKALGRNVTGFIEKVWNTHRTDIVVAGNAAKFLQHERLKHFLLSTGETILVEASPYDRIWGIGMAADDPHVNEPEAWKGLNL